MQRTLLFPAFLILLLGSWFLSDSSAQDGEPTPAPELGRTVILVRHAEKGKDDPRDPSLTAEGEARAKELARVLGDSNVTHLFSTPYKRTRQTLAPLAEAQGLEVGEYSPRDISALVREISSSPTGSVFVVAGHSNTTPGLYEQLAGREASGLEDHPQYGPMLPDDTYDRMFVVTLSPEGRGLDCTASLELRYGK